MDLPSSTICIPPEPPLCNTFALAMTTAKVMVTEGKACWWEQQGGPWHAISSLSTSPVGRRWHFTSVTTSDCLLRLDHDNSATQRRGASLVIETTISGVVSIMVIPASSVAAMSVDIITNPKALHPVMSQCPHCLRRFDTPAKCQHHSRSCDDNNSFEIDDDRGEYKWVGVRGEPPFVWLGGGPSFPPSTITYIG